MLIFYKKQYIYVGCTDLPGEQNVNSFLFLKTGENSTARSISDKGAYFSNQFQHNHCGETQKVCQIIKRG